MSQQPAILCATDLHGSGRRAVDVAAAWAKAADRSLCLIHVTAPATADLAVDVPPEVEPAAEAMRAHLRRRLDRLATALEVERARVEAAGVQCDARLAEGRPADAIVAEAARIEAFLIVVGHHEAPVDHGRVTKRFRDRILGTTAARVVREAPCPVLVTDVRGETPGDTLPELHGRWLVAMDFSGPALAALRFARPLSRRLGAELVLTHVVSPKPGLEGEQMPDEAARPWEGVLREHDTREAARRLAELADREAPDAKISQRLRFGSAAEELCMAAEDLGASVIVIGTHGREGLARFVLGSTAERCLRGSSVPVLVVRRIDARNA